MEYGWRNIEKEILAEVEDSKEAHLKEREYILKFRTNEPEYGYNKHTNDFTVGVRKEKQKKLGYVRCIETGEEFKSGAEAARCIGVSRAALSYAILHNTPCANLHWERLEASN